MEALIQDVADRGEESEMEKFKITYLETMVSWGCNLSCVGCTNFCDYRHHGFPDWGNVEQDLYGWSKVIEPEVFALMGGEPLLNPHLKQWICGVRKIFPNSFILLITNGVLLNKKAEIVKTMIEHTPGRIMITLHKDEEKIIESVESIIKNSDYRFIKKDQHERLIDIKYLLFNKEKQFSIHIKETDEFTKRYKGYGDRIYPYNTNNIEEAFKLCVDRPLLFNGRIYRCGKIPLVEKTLKLTGQSSSLKDALPWKICTDYTGLYYLDDNKKMQIFFDNLHKAEQVCMTCPGVNDDYIIDHKRNVYSKSELHDNNYLIVLDNTNRRRT